MNGRSATATVLLGALLAGGAAAGAGRPSPINAARPLILRSEYARWRETLPWER